MIIINFFATIMYYTLLILFFIVYTPICGLIWLVTTPFDKRRLVNGYLNCAIGFMITALNPFWRVTVHGLEGVDKNETFVYAPNHQSLTDICMLAATKLRIKWVSKKELTYIPFFGWMMGMAKYILLDRKDPKSQFKMMRNSEYFLNNDVSVAIFPEGTRTKDGEMGKFRDGASLLARKCNRRIMPILNAGNLNCMPKKGFIWSKKTEMHLYFLEPIDPAEYKTKELSNMVKAAIQAKKDELKALNS